MLKDGMLMPKLHVYVDCETGIAGENLCMEPIPWTISMDLFYGNGPWNFFKTYSRIIEKIEIAWSMPISREYVQPGQVTGHTHTHTVTVTLSLSHFKFRIFNQPKNPCVGNHINSPVTGPQSVAPVLSTHHCVIQLIMCTAATNYICSQFIR